MSEEEKRHYCQGFYNSSHNDICNRGRRKRDCIISAEHERLGDYIVNTIGCGCTLYDVRGGYTKKPQVEIYTLLVNNEYAALMKYINDSNTQVFTTVGNVSEVHGLQHEHKKREDKE